MPNFMLTLSFHLEFALLKKRKEKFIKYGSKLKRKHEHSGMFFEFELHVIYLRISTYLNSLLRLSTYLSTYLPTLGTYSHIQALILQSTYLLPQVISIISRSSSYLPTYLGYLFIYLRYTGYFLPTQTLKVPTHLGYLGI